MRPADAFFEQVPDAWKQEIFMARQIEGHGLCGLQRFLTTVGLLTNLRFDGISYGYDRRYCFPDYSDAISQLFLWTGEGDPEAGWVREKVTGRFGPAATTKPFNDDEATAP